MRMFLVCGMPGSGKTHFVQEFAKKNDIIYLNIDKFYEKVNGDECDRSHKFEVWIEFFKAIHEVELAGKDVVVETMALTAYNRKELTSWFPAFEHHMIYMIATGFYSCCKNVQNRTRKIDFDTMSKYFMKVEDPWKNELVDWKSIIKVININNTFAYFKTEVDENFPKETLKGIAEKYN